MTFSIQAPTAWSGVSFAHVVSESFYVFRASSPYTAGYLSFALFNILTYILFVATILACLACEN